MSSFVGVEQTLLHGHPGVAAGQRPHEHPLQQLEPVGSAGLVLRRWICTRSASPVSTTEFAGAFAVSVSTPPPLNAIASPAYKRPREARHRDSDLPAPWVTTRARRLRVRTVRPGKSPVAWLRWRARQPSMSTRRQRSRRFGSHSSRPGAIVLPVRTLPLAVQPPSRRFPCRRCLPRSGRRSARLRPRQRVIGCQRQHAAAGECQCLSGGAGPGRRRHGHTNSRALRPAHLL